MILLRLPISNKGGRSDIRGLEEKSKQLRNNPPKKRKRSKELNTPRIIEITCQVEGRKGSREGRGRAGR